MQTKTARSKIQIGTTRALDESGMASSSDVRVYTAFGELIDPGMNGLNRYGYAGAFGYEKFGISELNDSNMTPNPADTVFPFLHVGARWYDPATGRFLQRDPIGIRGGTNVYAYVGNAPTDDIDPEGLQRGRPPLQFYPPPRTPIEPPGYKTFPQPDTPFPDELTRPRSISNAAINCFMIATGGPYIPPTPPKPFPICFICGKFFGPSGAHFHRG